MQKTGIRQRDVPRVKKLLGDGMAPAEIAERYRCPVKTIESFLAPKVQEKKSGKSKADEPGAASTED